ncbi:MAG: Tfp pilus assembly protein FimT/FimU [Leptolyngbyaceae cyanobacterium]
MIPPTIDQKQQSNAGFTLIEVLAVVVIVAILAAIAAPSWLSYVARQRVSAVENDLEQVLKSAQQEAIAQRSNVTVTIDETADLPTIDVDGFVETLGPSGLRAGMVTLDAISPTSGTPNITKISFNYQGMVRDDQDLPIVVKISPENTPDNSSLRQCVVVTTLLGNIKTFKDPECSGDANFWNNAL